MMRPVATLWGREITRFVRQRSRVVGALLQPVVFWLLLGGGLSASFRPPGVAPGTSYLAYLYPGILALAPLAGVTLGAGQLLAATAVMVIVAFGLTNLGLLLAWRMESTQGFHAIMNLLLIPIWLLSGAFFPPAGVARPLGWLMAVDPLTYGLAALRACLDPAAAATLPSVALSLAVAVAFAVLACAGAVATAARATVAG